MSSSEGKASGKAFVLLFILLLMVLALLFKKSFDSSQVLFANDMPLGALKAEQSRLPGTFTGNWIDSNWVGLQSVSAAPNFTAALGSLLPPEMFLKVYAPFTMLLFGLSAWLCFRELRLHPMVCILGGLAAGLNMHAFSIACWGLGHWVISFAMIFLAIAALVTPSIQQLWVRGILAGAAVGIGLMEGFDVGAINSLYVGVFAIFVALVGEKISGKTILKASLLAGVTAVFAALTAAHTISSLVGTQVKGIQVAEQDTMSKEERWNWATQWSLPKKESLRVIIPGIFGYRMVDGENRLTKESYWGAVAQTPGYEEPGPNYHRGLARHSGSGEYLGIFVVLVAFFGVVQSVRKQNSPLSVMERRFVWFWTAMALISLLLAFGRHAPLFYKIVFALPYFSTIRNPIKFLHPFHIAMLILFAYGLESMVRSYFARPAKGSLAPGAFEKKWTVTSFAALGVAVVGGLIYASSRNDLVRYLATHFPADIAEKIAQFSFAEVRWFLLFFAVSVVLVVLVLRGKFVGKLKVAGILMGALIAIDLAHANLPWIVYQNYKQKYESNPIIEILREKPYQQRVIGMLPFQINEALSTFQQYVYYTEWLQHHFLYYNIQSIDVAQEPRVAADNAAYRQAFRNAGIQGMIRLWELANVKYLFGLAGGFVDSINQQLDPEQQRFKLVVPFGISQNTVGGPFLVETNATGPFALIEFTGALPRAKLYSQWQVITNDSRVLETLVSAEFKPAQTVILSDTLPASPQTNAQAGTVEFVSYHPKHIQLSAKATAPSVLLLNDKYDPVWKVFVDGKEAPLLRANYLMRGVFLDSGEHTVEFRFQPSLTTLYISLGALAVGIVLCAWLVIRRKRAGVVNPK